MQRQYFDYRCRGFTRNDHYVFGDCINRQYDSGPGASRIARRGFWIFPFSFLFCGMNIFTSATFTVLSNGKLSAVLSFQRTFELIFVLLLILPEFMGVTGVWLAVPIAELLTMVVAFLYQICL